MIARLLCNKASQTEGGKKAQSSGSSIVPELVCGIESQDKFDVSVLSRPPQERVGKQIEWLWNAHLNSCCTKQRIAKV